MNTPDHMVADAALRLFGKHVPAAAGMESEPLSQPFWRDFTGTGLDQVLASGLDSGIGDAVSVLRAAGYHAVAAPVAEAVLANWLAAKAGWQAEHGVATVSLAASALRLEEGAASFSLERAPWGRDADAIYVIAQSSEGTRIVRIEATEAKVEPGANLAGEPRDRLTFHVAPKLTRSAHDVDVNEVYALAALLRAAQMAGAMERVLELAIEHAGTRVQFGRQIGKFQAVQQMLARLASHVAAAVAAVDLGADAVAAGDGLFEAAVAKSRAGEAAGFATETGHQVIGAMGFTLEHPLQRYTRRLWSWRDEFGNEAFWNAQLGERVIGAGAGGVWPLIVDRPWLKYTEEACTAR